MNGDFQQTYQAAERAYGGGDYETAHHLASGLLKQLDVEERADDDQVHDAVLGWRAFVALLLGHIELHGRERPDQAANYYQLALDCQPQDTLADLARQGLQRSLVEPEAVQGESLPSMLQDPFLANTPPYLHLPKANPRPCHGSRKSPPLNKPKKHQRLSQNKPMNLINRFARTRTSQSR